MSNFLLCGVTFSEIDDIESVFIKRNDKLEKSELFYNNEPYGFVSIYGLQDLKIKGIEKYESKMSDDNQVTTTYSEDYIYLFKALQDKVRGDYKALIMLENGILAIKDFTPFEAYVQPLRLGEKEEERYRNYVDVTDVDEESEDFVDFYSLLEEE